MQSIYIRVKGIIKKGDQYLIVKHWVDDRIPDPYIWEFVDTAAVFGESPDEAIGRGIRELLSIEGTADRVLYTWSMVLGDTQCVGIAYECSLSDDEEAIELPEEYGEWKWVSKEEFPYYIENQYVLKDLERAL